MQIPKSLESIDQKKLTAFCLLVILIGGYILFFFHLGSYSLKEPDEGRYAEIPREMLERGDYLVPYLNYVRYFEKPPLLYWVTAGSFRLFGADEWSFRFPNALAALLCALSLYLFSQKWFGWRIAFSSALILISSFGFFAMGRIVTTDMLFSVLLFTAILSFNAYCREGKAVHRHLFYFLVALATLAKGPVSLILIGGTVLIYLFSERKLSLLKDLLNAKDILLYLLVTAPWFIAISLKEKEFFNFFFVDQHLLRFLTTKHDRSGPLYYFLPVLLGGMLPWSVFLPRALVGLWRVRELRLFFIWSGVVFLFFSVSGSKLPPYILPVFPALALILGYLFGSRWKDAVSKVEVTAYIVLFLIAGAAGIAALRGNLGAWVTDPSTLEVISSVKGLEIGLAMVSGVIIVALCIRSVRRYASLLGLLTGFSLSLIVLMMCQADVIDGLKTAKALALPINHSAEPGAVLVSYGSYQQTLPFYTKQRVYLVDYTGELKMGSENEDARPSFLTKKGFQDVLDSGRPVYCVVRQDWIEYINKMAPRPLRVIACQDERCLLSNRPYQP
jgi:4-amino-4-deoxy-L-arabinose transferase-like glycosyltransferase